MKEPEKANIHVVNLKSRYKPFYIITPEPFESAEGKFESPFSRSYSAAQGKNYHPDSVPSVYGWWNHWPVGQIPNDGRNATGIDRPSHSAIAEGHPLVVKGEGDSYLAASLYGLTDRGIDQLLSLAKSWIQPAQMEVLGSGYRNEGYDKYQRAYVLSCRDKGEPSTVAFEVAASQQSPLVNAAFVIKDWGRRAARLNINGKRVKPGRSFRSGHRHKVSGSDLVVWIEKESTQPITISLSPASN